MRWINVDLGIFNTLEAVESLGLALFYSKLSPFGLDVEAGSTAWSLNSLDEDKDAVYIYFQGEPKTSAHLQMDLNTELLQWLKEKFQGRETTLSIYL